MKTKHYVGGLALGALVGIGIGYWIATDPAKRRKINRFINDVEHKLGDTVDAAKERFTGIKDSIKGGCGCGCNGDLIDDEVMEIEAIIEAENILNAELDKKESKHK